MNEITQATRTAPTDVAKAGNFSKESVYRIAESISLELRNNEGKFDLWDVVENLGGKIICCSEEQLGQKDGTLIVYNEEYFEIFIPENNSPLRNNFTIAHELGHYALHSKAGKRPIIAKRFGSSRVEWEANWFASRFLMPSKIITQFDLDTPLKIASFFEVSLDSARIRLDYQ